MKTLELRVVNGINELWVKTDNGSQYLASMGAYGLSRSGWHSHHGPVHGDWADTEDVVKAYHLTGEITFH